MSPSTTRNSVNRVNLLREKSYKARREGYRRKAVTGVNPVTLIGVASLPPAGVRALFALLRRRYAQTLICTW